MTGLWAALAPVIEMILRVLLDLFLEKANAPDTAVEAGRDRARADRLADRVREYKNRAHPGRRAGPAR